MIVALNIVTNSHYNNLNKICVNLCNLLDNKSMMTVRKVKLKPSNSMFSIPSFTVPTCVRNTNFEFLKNMKFHMTSLSI